MQRSTMTHRDVCEESQEGHDRSQLHTMEAGRDATGWYEPEEVK